MIFKRHTCLIQIIFFLFLLVSGPQPEVYGQGNQSSQNSVAILPLQIHAAKDLSYLKDGINHMIASRLAANTGATIIDKSRTEKVLRELAIDDPATAPAELLRKAGKRLGADHLIATSLTAIGQAISLDARVIRTTGDTGPQNFYATAAKEDDVLLAINQMVWDITEKIFGKKNPTAAPTATAPATPVTGQPLSSYQTPHPDRAFMYPAEGEAGSPLIRPSGLAGTKGFTKSQNFNIPLQDMAVGDIDGDGANEVVLAGKSEIFVYRRTGNRFQQIANIPIKSKKYIIHAVGVADLNKNGRAEIYVSAADARGPDSFALEWKKGEPAYLFEHASWYIRTLLLPDGRTILAGQKGDITTPIKTGIYELKPGLEPQVVQKMQVPHSRVNLFDFALADLNNDGRAEIIAIDQYDRLQVIQPDGRVIWKSDEHYGGTKRFIGEEVLERDNNVSEDQRSQQRVYLPSRIIVRDLNNDGQPDILVNKNRESASRIFKNLKNYPSGEIHALTWNGFAFAELWHTRKISGYVVDYQMLADKDAPGKMSLFVGIGLNQLGGAWLQGLNNQCTVLTYKLDLGATEQ